jgi:integrase
MWIEQTKNGLRLYDRYKGYDGKIHKVSVPLARDTAQARRMAQIELQNKIMDKSTDASELSLNRLVELYLQSKDVKPSTLKNYERGFNQILNAIGSDIIISNLTAPYCIRKLSETHKAQSTLNRYVLLLNGLLEWAYTYGYMSERLHIKSFSDKKSQNKDVDVEYLEVNELQAVLDQMVGTMAYYVCKFLALTGCRIGEASALTWNDIDERYIHITKAYHKDNGITAPKTLSSRRDIFIQPELRELLKEYKEWRMLHMMAHKIRSEYLFFNNYGNIYTEQNLIGVLARISSPKHLHPHIFRHTHTALLAEQGVSLESIARRLGHTSSDITKQIYFHVTLKLKQRDEEVLSKVSIF